MTLTAEFVAEVHEHMDAATLLDAIALVAADVGRHQDASWTEEELNLAAELAARSHAEVTALLVCLATMHAGLVAWVAQRAGTTAQEILHDQSLMFREEF